MMPDALVAARHDSPPVGFPNATMTRIRMWARGPSVAVLVMAAGLFQPGTADAQSVSGVVVDGSNTPVPGVVVSLVDVANTLAAARALTNERGEYRLTTARAGTYRLQTLRIGFRPVSSEPLALGSGETATRRLMVTGVPFALAAVRVEGRSSCRALGDAAATFAVWAQARAALTATELTAGERAVMATTVTYERTLDSLGRRVVDETADVRSAYVTQPWRSLSPAEVRQSGYVGIDRDGWTAYSAPGLDVLLSSTFVEDHCFRLTTGADPGQIGVAFEPTRERRRRGLAEVRGTLWLDRASSELRRLEFGYVNLLPEQEAIAGGELAFVRLATGAWAISRWSVRMPALEEGFRAARALRANVRVTAVKVAGGELALAMRGADTLWARAPLVIAGTVVDSASAAPVADARVRLGTPAGPVGFESVTDPGGRFTVPDVLPGRYTVDVRTPSLDSVNVVHEVPLTVIHADSAVRLRVPTGGQVLAALCGRQRLAAPGIVVGTLSTRGDLSLPSGVKLVVEWTEESPRAAGDTATAPAAAAGDSLPTGRPPVERQTRWVETRADARGVFRLCGVPLDTPLAVRAEADSLGAEPVSVRITRGRTARAVLVLDRAVSRAAVFTGLVLADTNRRPIAGAEIVMPELTKAVLTNDAGAFRVSEVPPGRYRVQVRRLGFGPLDTTITFAASQTVERRIYLRRVVTLDSVSVVAERVVIRSFEEHRNIGLGHFFTREELAKQEGRTLSAVLGQTLGIRMAQGRGNYAWITSSRGVRSLSGGIAPDEADRHRGARTGCYAQVYVDRQIVYRARDGEPLFNVNSISPGQIEAIEYYASPAQTPPEYTELNSVCGVLVIHTRQSP